MKTMYVKGNRIDYKETKYANKTVLDAWLVTGVRYKESDYFGEYDSVKQLERVVKDCIIESVLDDLTQ